MDALLKGDWAAFGLWLLEPLGRIILILVAALALWKVLDGTTHRIIATIVRRTEEGRPPEEIAKRITTLTNVITHTAAAAIAVVAALSVVAELGVNIGPLLAGAGIVGLAVGFGAQHLVRDVITGLFILVEGQYHQGDVVKIAGIAGYVEDINLRRTVLRDLDGTVHYIPNGEVTTVSNMTKEWSRVNLDVEVAYEEDVDRVIVVLNRVGKELATDATFGPMILEAPQVLRVEALGSSGVTIKMLGVTRPLKQWEVMGELRKRIKEAFDREGIEIPYPRRAVVIESFPRDLTRPGQRSGERRESASPKDT